MFKASKVIDNAESRLAIAQKAYYDFSGKSKSGLTLTRYGDIILVDDDYDKWLADFDDYDDSFEDVVEYILSGAEEDDVSDYYDRLCANCPVLYSRIGSGEHNNDLHGLVECLRAHELTDEQIEMIFDEIGEDLESALIPEEESVD